MSLSFARTSRSYVGWGLLLLNSVVLGLTITTSNDANVLAAAGLITNGGLTLNSAVYVGDALASGTYVSGPLGIPDGIILTSGHASDATNPPLANSPSNLDGQPGSALCDAISAGGSHDAAVLTLSVTTTAAINGITFDLIFATAEYPEFVGTAYSDTFVIFVDGVQVAKDTMGNPITLNGGFFSSANVVTPPASGTTYGGSTPLLTGSAPLTPGPHVIQIAICDIADERLDSAALLQIQACNGDCAIGVVKASSTVEPPEASSTEYPPEPSTSSVYVEPIATTSYPETETSIPQSIAPVATTIPSVDLTSTIVPSVEPTATIVPSVEPTATIVPSVEPTATIVPSVEPTATIIPSVEPTATIIPSVDLTSALPTSAEPVDLVSTTLAIEADGSVPSVAPIAEPIIEPTIAPVPPVVIVIGIEIIISIEYFINVVIVLDVTTTKTVSKCITETRPIYNTPVPGYPCYVCALEKQGETCDKESALTVYTTTFPSSLLASEVPCLYKLCSTCPTGTITDVPHYANKGGVANYVPKQTSEAHRYDQGGVIADNSASVYETPAPSTPLQYTSGGVERSAAVGGKVWGLIACFTFALLCCS